MKPDSFSYVEYLSIFTTFIYGYVATRFFSGWSVMFNFRHTIKFSIEHLAWTLFTFVLLIDIWWGSWNESNLIDKSKLYYYLSLLSSLVFYIISVILFPPVSKARSLDFRKYFGRMRSRIFLALIALFVSLEVEYFVFQDDPSEDIYINLSAIALASIGYFSRSIAVQRTILVVAWIALVIHIATLAPINEGNLPPLNFSLREYLTVFTALIYGFIASRFFSGWGMMISKFDKITFSKEHLVWTILLFCLLLDLWMGSWQRERYIVLSVRHFILSLTLPMTFYALGTVSFPVIKSKENTDMRIFFRLHKKPIYLMLALVMVSNAVIANVMEEPSLLNSENLFRLLAVGLALIAAFSKKITVERTIIAAGCIVLLVHAFVEK